MIDLHTHSSASDGTDSPAALVRAAHAAGVSTVAITDHDTTNGWAAAASEAIRLGVALVRGVEVSSAMRGRSVHLLGYLADPTQPPLADLLASTAANREARLRKMTALIARDYPVTWDSVLAQTTDGTTLGRPHIADALVSAGVVPDREAAFATIVAGRGPYYVAYKAAPTVDAVRAIVDSGGVPVLAHPFAASRGQGLTDDDVALLAAHGLAGLEVWHREMDDAARARALGLARRLALLTTGSSDYHGAGKPNQLGEHYTSADVLGEIALRGVLPIV